MRLRVRNKYVTVKQVTKFVRLSIMAYKEKSCYIWLRLVVNQGTTSG